MIGRGIFGKPWMFAEAGEKLPQKSLGGGGQSPGGFGDKDFSEDFLEGSLVLKFTTRGNCSSFSTSTLPDSSFGRTSKSDRRIFCFGIQPKYTTYLFLEDVDIKFHRMFTNLVWIKDSLLKLAYGQ